MTESLVNCLFANEDPRRIRRQNIQFVISSPPGGGGRNSTGRTIKLIARSIFMDRVACVVLSSPGLSAAAAAPVKVQEKSAEIRFA